MLVVQDCQNSIYELLHSDSTLAALNVTTHLASPKNLHNPFIVLSLAKLRLEHRVWLRLYHIDLQVSLYSQGANQKLLLQVADHVYRLLNAESIGIKRYLVLAAALTDAMWEQGKDMKTVKLSLNYKLLIEESALHE